MIVKVILALEHLFKQALGVWGGREGGEWLTTVFVVPLSLFKSGEITKYVHPNKEKFARLVFFRIRKDIA